MNEKAQETIEHKGDFPTDTGGLPRAVSPSVVELADGDTTRTSHRAGRQASR